MKYRKILRGTRKIKKKPLDAPNIDRHQNNPKKTKNPAATQKWTHNSWIFFFCFFWCLCRFGASSIFFFFGTCADLATLISQNIGKYQKNQATRYTKHRQAPKRPKKQKKKIQQLFRNGSIVPIYFFGCLCRFDISNNLIFLFFFRIYINLIILISQIIDRFQKTKKTKPLNITNIDRHQKKPKK